MRMIKPLLAAAAALAFGAVGAADAQTLKTVQDRGKLVCGVSQGIAGFSIKDDKGEWTGFDVDFCRALAAAIFNDPSKVEFVPLTATERFDALKDKKIDVLSRNSTWTLGREEDSNLVFAGVTYYDGQAFMVPKSRNATSALELDGSKVCVQKGTTSEPNAKDFFETNHVNYEFVEGDTVADIVANYLAGQVQRADDRRVAALRAALAVPEARRAHDPAGRHLQGAARAGGAPGRHAMVQYRQVGELRAHRRRGAWRLLEDDRRGAEVAEAGGEAAGRDRGRLRQAARPHRTPGRPTRSAPSATTARSSTATSARTPSSAFPRGLNELWDNGGIQYAPPIR